MTGTKLHADKDKPAGTLNGGHIIRLRDSDSLFPRRDRGAFEFDGKELAERVIEADGMGIRMAFRIPLTIMVIVALSIVSLLSYMTVSGGEFERAEQSVHSEVNYLCLQLKSLGERSEAFARVVDSPNGASKNTAAVNRDDYRLLSDSVGDVLEGYTLAETGTVAIVADGAVVASDDERLLVGDDIRESLGEEASKAITDSIGNGKLLQIPLEGVLAPESSDADADGFLMAAQQGDYTVVIVEPSSMVYRDRMSIMIRESSVALVVLILMFIFLDRLLNHMVARRIDKVNESLEHITAGDLDTRVDETGTREFKSLAKRINVTVDALNGWIDEAESRMDAELATAKAIQESALPRTFPAFPDIPRFDLYASMDPAREVGGDFYDFFLVGEGCTPEAGKLGFVMADVSGKGVPAALFMMRAKALIREHVSGEMELGDAVAAANRKICEGNDAGMFVTAWIGVLDYATGRIDYVNAGHNPPLLRKADGSCQWLREKSGLVLGLFDMEYKQLSIECEARDMLLLYTDGVTEAFDAEGALYGEDRLFALVEEGGKLSPEELQQVVRADVAAHAEGAEQSDDITILVLEVGEGGADGGGLHEL